MPHGLQSHCFVYKEGAANLTEYYQTEDANLAEKSEGLCFKKTNFEQVSCMCRQVNYPASHGGSHDEKDKD